MQSVAEKVERIQAAVEFVSTPSLSPFLRDQLQSALDAFAEYMRGIGIEVEDRVLVKVDKEVSGVAFYDPAAKLIVIDESVAADMDLVLHEAAHHYILRPPKVLADLGGNGFSALEAGLVDYLVASFKNDPAIAKVFAQLRLGQDHVRNLENDAKFSRDVMGDPVHAIGEVWGGCFWEVRRLLGRDITDRSLYEAWAALAPADLRSGDVSRFVERVVQLQPDAADEVREVFERRDISALTKKRPRRGR